MCTTLQSVLHISVSKCWRIICVGEPGLQVFPLCDSKVLQHLMCRSQLFTSLLLASFTNYSILCGCKRPQHPPTPSVLLLWVCIADVQHSPGAVATPRLSESRDFNSEGKGSQLLANWFLC